MFKESVKIQYGDTEWYKSIVEKGYEKATLNDYDKQKNWAFFPLYPLIMILIKNDYYFIILLLLSNLITTFLLYKIVCDIFDETIAKYSILYFHFFLEALVYWLLDPEGLLALCWIASYYFMKRKQFFLSSVFSFFASLAKPNGFLVFILPLIQLILNFRKLNYSEKIRLLLTTTSPLLGVFLFSFYLYLITGDFLAWVKIQKTWGASFSNSLIQLYQLFKSPLFVSRWGWDPTFLNWLVFISVIIAIYGLISRKLWDLAMFLFAVSLLSFLNFGVWVHGRHIAPLFLILLACLYI